MSEFRNALRLPLVERQSPMFLNFDVQDPCSRRMIGSVRLKLDWDKRTWQVDEDRSSTWNRFSTSRTGVFFSHNQGICLRDEFMRDAALLANAPKAALDLAARNGGAQVAAMVDRTLAGATVTWKQEPGAAAAAAPQPAGMREKLIARLRELLPCDIGSTATDPRNGKLTKWYVVAQNCQRFSGTSCGSLPGFVSSFLGADRLLNGRPSGVKAAKEYMDKRSLSGTNKVRTWGLKYGAWVEAGDDRRPKMGDIYALLDRDGAGKPLTDKKNANISHVGVIINAEGNTWTTADLGQLDGFAGKVDLPRDYRRDSGQLFGEVRHGGIDPYRVVAGWVDIERYFEQQ